MLDHLNSTRRPSSQRSLRSSHRLAHVVLCSVALCGLLLAAEPGLQATYYDNQDLTGSTVSRVDPTLNFNWAAGSPDASMAVDYFSVRWMAQMRPRYSENYTLYITTDDGVRLWVDGRLVVDAWKAKSSSTLTAVVPLVAGMAHQVRVEYFELSGYAVARLEWSSPSQVREVIPGSCLDAVAVPPALPVQVAASFVPTGTALSWQMHSVDVASFEVQRQDASGAFALLATIPGDQRGFVDVGTPVAGVPVNYRVRSINAAGPSAWVPVQALIPTGSDATGLLATYWDNVDFTGSWEKRIDPTLNFAWGSGRPATQIGADTFSVRWTGHLIPPTTGLYTLYMTSDDGVRVWVDGILVIEAWVPRQATTSTVTIPMFAGQRHAIRVDFFEQAGDATARLEWSGPQVERMVIPAERMLAGPILPQTPTRLIAAATSLPTAPICLTWQSMDGDLAAFDIERMTSDADFVPVATVPGTVRSWDDATAPVGSMLRYRIRAVNSQGAGGWVQVDATLPPLATTPGYLATYWDNRDFTGTWIKRLDPAIDFNWAGGAPATHIAADTFSVRWTGAVIPVSGGTYTFFATSDDGVRLWVDDTLVADSWISRSAATSTGTAQLVAGAVHQIRLEFFEGYGNATARLEWSGPGVSRQLVPGIQLASSIAPSITAAGAAPQPVVGRSTTVSATATDDGPSVALTYTWSASGPAQVAFTPNGTNAAQLAQADFQAAGSYVLTVVVRDAGGLASVRTVPVTVVHTPSGVSVTPLEIEVPSGGTHSFTARLLDQFSAVMPAPSNASWSVSGGGIIVSSGIDTAIFTAAACGGVGQHTVTGSLAGYSGAATVVVSSTGALPSIRPPYTASGTVGIPFSYTIKACNGPTAFAATNLPVGLSLDAVTGVISGTPQVAGTANVTLLASNANGTGSASLTCTVAPGAPVLTWPEPAPIPAGTLLGPGQLQATASVPGTFAYSPAAGTELPAGTHQLSVMFTPTDGVNYLPATAQVTLQVQALVPAIAWSVPSPIVYGSPLSAVQLNATATVPGTWTYQPGLGIILDAGTHPLTVVFTPTDRARYTTATAEVIQVVQQRVPTITWSNPAAITTGTALSASQLNATASLPGGFAFSPALGALLPTGVHTLTAVFTPTDGVNHASASASVALTVLATQEQVPALTWSVSSGAIPAGGGSATLTASLDRAAAVTATAQIWWSGFTDLTSFETLPTSISIPAGATSATVTVTTAPNATFGRAVALQALLAHPDGCVMGASPTATIAVAATPELPQVSWRASDVHVFQGESAASLQVTLDRVASTDLHIVYGVAGTAVAGVLDGDDQLQPASADYVTLSGTLLIPSGSTSATLDVPLGDAAAATDERTVVLGLTAGAAYRLGSTTTTTVRIVPRGAQPPALAAPIIDPPSGSFLDHVLVHMQASPVSAAVWYTMTSDGTTPANPVPGEAQRYRDGVSLSAGSYRIKAVSAWSTTSGWTAGPVAETRILVQASGNDGDGGNDGSGPISPPAGEVASVVSPACLQFTVDPASKLQVTVYAYVETTDQDGYTQRQIYAAVPAQVDGAGRGWVNVPLHPRSTTTALIVGVDALGTRTQTQKTITWTPTDLLDGNQPVVIRAGDSILACLGQPAQSATASPQASAPPAGYGTVLAASTVDPAALPYLISSGISGFLPIQAQAGEPVVLLYPRSGSFTPQVTRTDGSSVQTSRSIKATHARFTDPAGPLLAQTGFPRPVSVNIDALTDGYVEAFIEDGSGSLSSGSGDQSISLTVNDFLDASGSGWGPWTINHPRVVLRTTSPDKLIIATREITAFKIAWEPMAVGLKSPQTPTDYPHLSVLERVDIVPFIEEFSVGSGVSVQDKGSDGTLRTEARAYRNNTRSASDTRVEFDPIIPTQRGAHGDVELSRDEPVTIPIRWVAFDVQGLPFQLDPEEELSGSGFGLSGYGFGELGYQSEEEWSDYSGPWHYYFDWDTGVRYRFKWYWDLRQSVHPGFRQWTWEMPEEHQIAVRINSRVYRIPGDALWIGGSAPYIDYWTYLLWNPSVESTGVDCWIRTYDNGPANYWPPTEIAVEPGTTLRVKITATRLRIYSTGGNEGQGSQIGSLYEFTEGFHEAWSGRAPPGWHYQEGVFTYTMLQAKPGRYYVSYPGGLFADGIDPIAYPAGFEVIVRGPGLETNGSPTVPVDRLTIGVFDLGAPPDPSYGSHEIELQADHSRIDLGATWADRDAGIATRSLSGQYSFTRPYEMWFNMNPQGGGFDAMGQYLGTEIAPRFNRDDAVGFDISVTLNGVETTRRACFERISQTSGRSPDAASPLLDLSGGLAISPASGNAMLTVPVVAKGGSQLSLTMTYNSQEGLDHGYGPGWRTNWDIELLGDYLVDETGARVARTGPAGGPAYINTGKSISRRDGTWLDFDDLGKLTRIRHVNGRTWSVERNSDGFITKVTDSWGTPDLVLHPKPVERNRQTGMSALWIRQDGTWDVAMSGDPLVTNGAQAWKFAYHGEDKSYALSEVTCTGCSVTDAANRGIVPASHAKSFAYETVTDANQLFGQQVNYARCTEVKIGGEHIWAIAYTKGQDTATDVLLRSRTVVTDPLGHTTTWYQPTWGSWTHLIDAGGIVHRRELKDNVLSTWTQVGEEKPAGVPSTGHREDEVVVTLDGVTRLPLRTRRLLNSTGAEQVTDYAWNTQSGKIPEGMALLNRITRFGVEGIDGSGSPVDLVYDRTYYLGGKQAGQLRQSRGPQGVVTNEVNSDGVLTSVKDPNEQSWTMHESIAGLRYTASTPASRVTKMTPSTRDGSLPGRITRPTGEVVDVTYDAFGRVITTTDVKTGATSSTVYGAFGEVLQSTDVDQRVTTLTYDSLLRPVRQHVVLPDAEPGPPGSPAPPQTATVPDVVWNHTKDILNGSTRWLTTQTRAGNPQALSKQWQDALGRTVRRQQFHSSGVSAAGMTTGSYQAETSSWTYGAAGTAGRLLEQAVGEGAHLLVTTYQHDYAGRLLRSEVQVLVDGLKPSQTWTRNNLGWLLSTTTASGATSWMTYDHAGRLVRQVNPAGGWTWTGYDIHGTPTQIFSPALNPSRQETDADGESTAVVDARGIRDSWSFSLNGSVQQITTLRGQAPGDGPAAIEQTLVNLAPAAASVAGIQLPGNAVARSVILDGHRNQAQTTIVEQDIDGSPRRLSGTGRPEQMLRQSSTGATWLSQQTRHEADSHGAFWVAKRTSSAEETLAGLPKSVTDERGQVTSSTPNALTGEVDWVIRGSGAQQQATWVAVRDAFGRPTLEKTMLPASPGQPARTSERTSDYNALGQLVSVAIKDGPTTTYAYDVDGRLVRMTRGTDAPVTRTYDVLGQVTAEGPAGQQTTRLYDALGRLVRTTRGGSTTYQDYDPAHGAVVRVIEPGTRVTTYERNARAQVTAVKLPDQSRMEFGRDRVGRMVSRKRTGATSGESWTHDPQTGQVATYQDRSGRKTVFGYTATGSCNAITLLDAQGTVVAKRFPGTADQSGAADGAIRSQLMRELVGADLQDPGATGKLMEWRTDLSGHRVAQVTPAGTVGSAHDVAGTPLSRGFLDYRYDGANRLERIFQGGNQQLSQSYTADGRLERQELPNGVVRTLGYDNQGRLSQVTVTSGNDAMHWAVRRDDLGRIRWASGPEGETSYQYLTDRLHLESRTGGDGEVIAYGHDQLGNLERMDSYAGVANRSEAFGGGAMPTLLVAQAGSWSVADGHLVAASGVSEMTWLLAESGRLIAPVLSVTVSGDGLPDIALDDGNPSTPAAIIALEVGIQDGLRMGRLELGNAGSLAALVHSTWLPLPQAGRIEVSVGATGIVVARLTDADGQGASVEAALLSELAGLDKATLESGSATAWFDDLQWATATQKTVSGRLLNPDHQITTVTEELIFGNGSPTQTTTIENTYDAAGNLTREKTTLPNGQVVESSASFDAFDRMVSRTTSAGTVAYRWAPGGNIPVGETFTSSGGGEPIETAILADDQGLLQHGTTQYGSIGTGQALWETRGSTRITYAIDAQGHIGGLIGDLGQVHHSWAGQIGYLDKRRYTAYGIPSIRTAEALQIGVASATLGYRQMAGPVAGPGYRGGWTDGKSGLQRFGARWYAPNLAQFMTEDPAKAGNAWYAYCGGDPVNRWDPSGLDDISVGSADGRLVEENGDDVFWLSDDFSTATELKYGLGTGSRGAVSRVGRLDPANPSMVITSQSFGGGRISLENLKRLAHSQHNVGAIPSTQIGTDIALLSRLEGASIAVLEGGSGGRASSTITEGDWATYLPAIQSHYERIIAESGASPDEQAAALAQLSRNRARTGALAGEMATLMQGELYGTALAAPIAGGAQLAWKAFRGLRQGETGIETVVDAVLDPVSVGGSTTGAMGPLRRRYDTTEFGVETAEGYGTKSFIVSYNKPALQGRIHGTFDTKTGELYIDTVRVSEQRQGLGSALYDQLLGAVRKNGGQIKTIAGNLRSVNKDVFVQSGLEATPAYKTRVGLGYTRVVVYPSAENDYNLVMALP